MNLSLIITIIAVLIILPWGGLKLFQKLGIVEHKKWADYYKRIPVPNAQGIVLWITMICCILLLGWQYKEYSSLIIYIIAGTILAIISTIDLFKPIPSRIRLLMQITLFGRIVIYGGISIETIRMTGSDVPIISWISIVGSIIRFGVCTNAINWFDGIQGQSSGVTSVGAFALWAVVSFIVLPSYDTLNPEILHQLEITKIIALSLGIVSFIYTIIEYKPLGLIRDIGTTIYGFSLAYLALLGGAKVGTLVVTLSLVLFDMIWVIGNRLVVLKKNPLKGDYTHLHHRLIANGWTRSEVRWFVWIRSMVMTILMILQGTNSIHKRIIFIMMAIIFFAAHIYLFWIKKLPNEMKVDFTTEEVEDLKMEI